MKTIIWLGPCASPQRLEALLAELGFAPIFAANASDAINLASLRAAVAIVIAVEPEKTASIVSYLKTASPASELLLATHVHAPPWFRAALDHGARDLIDLADEDPRHLAGALERAAARHQRAQRERALIMKLQTTNEEFLKSMVALERRNQELSELMQGELFEEGPTRVLVIDDEPAIAALIELVLKDRGYEVHIAGDGEAALALFGEHAFQIVITDKNLPGKDGITIMREVKAARPETDVILITAYGSKESAIAALNCGATAYLEKPFDDIDDIGRRVDAIVASQRSRQKKQEFLRLFKERNRAFLIEYRKIRTELDAWLEEHA